MIYKEKKHTPIQEQVYPPINKPIYGFAYERDQYTTSLKCKPTLGIIIPVYEDMICDGANIYSSDFRFREFKRDGKTLKSGSVYGYSRQYADTYEEAVSEYNKLILEHIQALEDFISKLKKDLIVTDE